MNTIKTNADPDATLHKFPRRKKKLEGKKANANEKVTEQWHWKGEQLLVIVPSVAIPVPKTLLI